MVSIYLKWYLFRYLKWYLIIQISMKNSVLNHNWYETRVQNSVFPLQIKS